MKIFSPQVSTNSNVASEVPVKKTGPKGKKRSVTTEKKPITENEVREKLAAHVETSNTAKSKVIKQNSAQLGSGFMNESINTKKITTEISAESEEKPAPMDSVKESHLLMSDVKLNDPNDSNTQEKLRTVLSKGAFNFNPRERETLEKILGNN
jgi:hypothetical protein